ncbi:MAG: heme-copper oxidase subunit III [bacterium]
MNKSLLGLLMFIGSEVMFFGGLISVFLILRSGSVVWPPANQPLLPQTVTAINTFFLLVSGLTMHHSLKSIRANKGRNLLRWLSGTAVLGVTFLAIQGSEWIRLVGYGLTMTSSIYGGTFYALIGCHGLHVFGAVISLLFVLKKAFSGGYSVKAHTGVALCTMYWYFVVAIWPILYILVYLNF